MEETSKSISTPQDLVAAFKRSGMQDSLRKAIYQEFLDSPNKDKFVADLTARIQTAMAAETFKARSKKDRPLELYQNMTTRQTLLANAALDVERSLKKKEKEKELEKEGKYGPIKKQLQKILLESRGIKVADSDSDNEPSPPAETEPEAERETEKEHPQPPSVPPTPQIPSTSTVPALPTPPHPPPIPPLPKD